MPRFATLTTCQKQRFLPAFWGTSSVERGRAPLVRECECPQCYSHWLVGLRLLVSQL